MEYAALILCELCVLICQQYLHYKGPKQQRISTSRTSREHYKAVNVNGSKDIPCEHNIRHNGTMYATANMVRARACGKLVLGDKANPQTTFHLNEGHVTDMCEIGGDLQSQRDVHYEVKVPSALTKTRQAG